MVQSAVAQLVPQLLTQHCQMVDEEETSARCDVTV